jgi:hypothetical protein
MLDFVPDISVEAVSPRLVAALSAQLGLRADTAPETLTRAAPHPESA